ncbi:hypothetical protein LCGC14_2134560, partial [marine sediment metagenome]
MTMTAPQVSELSGEFVALVDETKVPFAPGFNVETLKEVDPDPLFVIVKVKTGLGQQGHGPDYTAAVLTDIAEQINTKRPSGYKGHQDKDRVDWEWRDPVTAWVGALFDTNEQALFVKGYIPLTAPDLRTQLSLARSGADIVNSVSIWGTREVDERTNEVTSFDLWSLDWTPKGRAGMESTLVGIAGEQTKEEHVDRKEVLQSVTVDELPDHVQEKLRKEGHSTAVDELKQEIAFIGEMRVIFELDQNADPADIIEKVTALVSHQRSGDLEVKVADAAKEISGEMQREAVVSYVLPRVSHATTDEELVAEIATAQELPFIKVLEGDGKIPVVSGSLGSEK